jgi:rhodanese-related sulfurtransferase
MRSRGSSRSEEAATLLRESGFDARALEGGFPAWDAAGYPFARGEDI